MLCIGLQPRWYAAAETLALALRGASLESTLTLSHPTSMPPPVAPRNQCVQTQLSLRQRQAEILVLSKLPNDVKAIRDDLNVIVGCLVGLSRFYPIISACRPRCNTHKVSRCPHDASFL